MRWRDELDALSFDSVSRMIAGGIVLGGLIGAALVGTGAVGESSSVSAAQGTPVVDPPERSPVCLRVDPREVGLNTSLEAAVVQAFPTAGDQLFEGWPQRVDGSWRWDRETPSDDGTVSSIEETATAEDARGVRWTALRYDLDQASGGAPTQGLRLVVPQSYVGDAPPESGLPDVSDPASIPPGGSVVLDADALAPATYARLVDAVPGAPGGDARVAITPTGPGEVVVTIGTSRAVDRTTLLWPAVTDAHAEVVPDDDLRDFVLRQVVLDVSSEQGADLYRSVLQGTVPKATARGVRTVDVVTGGTLATSRARTLGEEGLPVSRSYFGTGLRRTVREDGDGSVILTRSVTRGDQRLRFGELYDADGRPRGIDAAIRVPGVSSAVASEYNRAFAGRPAEVSGSVNLVLDLDDDDLSTVREDSLEVVSDWFNSDSDGQRFARSVLRLKGLATAQDVSDWLEGAQPAVVDRIATTMAGDDASTPDRAAAAVMRVVATQDDDPWATYLAYTGALTEQDADVPAALAQWGAAVQRASRTSYEGFGDATCASVDGA